MPTKLILRDQTDDQAVEQIKTLVLGLHAHPEYLKAHGQFSPRSHYEPASIKKMLEEYHALEFSETLVERALLRLYEDGRIYGNEYYDSDDHWFVKNFSLGVDERTQRLEDIAREAAKSGKSPADSADADALYLTQRVFERQEGKKAPPPNHLKKIINMYLRMQSLLK
ncbi:hypothetical protein KY363_06005 [Candidatus Woesearchaeota archaeon]|nr:hypothetical protein [Candidatus Woesearchaeota archaeon]